MSKNPFHSNVNYAFLSVSIALFAIFGYNYLTSYPPVLCGIVGGALGLISYFGLSIVFRYLVSNFDKLPVGITVSIFTFFASLYILKLIGFRLPSNVYYISILVVALCVICFFWSIASIKQNKSKLYFIGILLPLLVLITALYWFVTEGNDPFEGKLAPPTINENITLLSQNGIESPALKGSYEIEKFTYGSGMDFRRQEYADGVKYKTDSVDASLILPAWKGKLKKWREKYWHFKVSALPVNGRVYFPKSQSKVPLVLIVHGNHSMIDYSDAGYGYLGESMASRGFAVVSVDENFLNGHWSGDFRGKEMPARAWLLLKHLEQWEIWNENPEHDLYDKIDMDNIMLIGHSRGGEAVSIAASFNKLKYFPDNAKEEFDFDFNIKSIVSIAPTDYRYHRQMDLENINYLSLQGSYDSDEISFWGMRPYHRLKFTDSESWVKAGVYIHKANHGQFNSTWGRSDMGAPFKWLLNTQPMISGNDQQQAANVFISAFAEATLKGKSEYLPIFQNSDKAHDWLPTNYYLTQFQKSNDLIIQDFEEDIEISTGRNSITINTENLKVWREENLSTRDKGSQENNAVVLGWDYGENIDKDSLASYNLQLNNSTLRSDTVKSIIIRAAAGNQKDLEGLENIEDDENAKKKPAEDNSLPLDFSIELIDSLGQTASIQISQIKQIAPPLKTRFTKLGSLDKEIFGADWEVQLQTFHLPIKDFNLSNDSFDLSTLKTISLVFDQGTKGVIVIDDIGWSYDSKKL